MSDTLDPQSVDISLSPALQAVYETSHAIEACGASTELTNAVVKNSDALRAVNAEVHRRIQTEAELETERMRLAACSTAALGYFDGECLPEYRSAALDDVLALRAKLDAYRAVRARAKERRRSNTELLKQTLDELLAVEDLG